ncbi:uncharacterized protein L969DRAFT_93982 [Mixia osmundae IAM 14324]|uniref:Mitochondrial transcription factor 1 n=1 Tax=Mixia osmundae (strain CBS 9802 / IAM 14324 / JCM 22182 / KY 12970) TaxID=764103 RepID=G7E8Q6_MIXOS|nr:uncharacterized protein L969DRAFT_93982 [Mixia osmundae IAM 14324]KEI40160.1 hypothetical protein L969DRAFT_93982 [Mixia osmundae IAM 14324]GAA99524.1 hypothetical protein E5Q_06225 [Mixia osmundae IAM 14324]
MTWLDLAYKSVPRALTLRNAACSPRQRHLAFPLLGARLKSNAATTSSSARRKSIPRASSSAASPVAASGKPRARPIRSPLYHARRLQVADEAAARQLIKIWDLPSRRDLTVIVPCAGHGVLAREIAKLPHEVIRKVITMEVMPTFQPGLLAGAKKFDKWHHQASLPLNWDSYDTIESQGLLANVDPKPWESDEPANVFVALQLPVNIYCEKFVSSALHCIVSKMWLYRYGRIDIGVLLASSTLSRMEAKPGDPNYHKLAAQLRCICSVEKPTLLKPGLAVRGRAVLSDTADSPEHAAAILRPLKEPLITSEGVWEAYEYIARRLFSTINTPWTKSLPSIAAGAGILEQKMIAAGHVYDPNMLPRQMTPEHLLHLTEAFQAWPFRPRTLYDDLDESLDDFI